MNLIDLADIHAAAAGVRLPASSLLKGETAPVRMSKSRLAKIQALVNKQRRSLINVNAKRRAK